MMVNKMNNLIIIPYISDHGKIILSSQMNHILTQKDADYDGDPASLVEDGLAFTGMYNNKIIAAGGMKKLWRGVAEGWVLATNEVWQHPLIVARAIKKNFELFAKKNDLKRIQTAVRADFKIGIRFAKWLGLKNEGLMKNYGYDGSDHYRFARIF
jgi:hypothetical protein